MKSKYVLASIVFLSTFLTSILIFGGNYSSVGFVNSNASFQQSETRRKIESFLAEDRQNGFQWIKEISEGKGSQILREATATDTLVKKMRKMNCSALPADFCAAWSDHLQAWEDLSKVVNQEIDTSNASYETEAKYTQKNNEIFKTYRILIEMARRNGVEFSY